MGKAPSGTSGLQNWPERYARFLEDGSRGPAPDDPDAVEQLGRALAQERVALGELVRVHTAIISQQARASGGAKPESIAASGPVFERLLTAYNAQRQEEHDRNARYVSALIENIDVGVTLIGADYRIILTNAAQGRIFNKDPALFVGRPCYEEFEKRAERCPHCPGAVTLATGQPAATYTEGIRDNGTRLRAHIQSFPIFGADGRPTAFVEIVQDITHQKHTEAELRKFETLSDQAVYGIGVVDLAGRLEYVNRAFAEMHGYTPAELRGRHVSVFHTAEQLPRVNELLLRIQREGGFVGEEVWHVRRDGSTFPTLMNCNLIVDENGKPTHMSATAVDITERKRAEDLLRLQRDVSMALSAAMTLPEALEHLLGALLQVEGVDCGGVYLVDEATGAVELACHRNVSERFAAAMRRFTADTPNTQPFRALRTAEPALWHRGDPSPLADVLLAEGLTVAATVPVCAQGRVVALLSLGSRTRPEFPVASRQAFETIAGRIGPVVERGRHEAALRESEELFRTLCTTAPVGIFLAAADTRCVYVNPELERICGLPAERCLGFGWLSVVHPADREAVLAEVEETRRAGLDFAREFRLLRPDGAERWVRVQTASITASDGQVQRRVGLVADITDTRLAEEQARQHHEQLAHAARVGSIGAMASGLAHELGQPLSAILYYARGCATHLTSGRWGLAEVGLTLQQISAQAERAGEFIRHISAFVRRSEPDRREIDVNAVIHNAVRFTSLLLRETPVQLELRLAENLPAVMADAIQIEQVVVNLIRNALEAMSALALAARHLTIESRPATDGGVTVVVRDTGPGVAPSLVPRLFDAFATTKAQGTGLGLSISRTIIEDVHAGKLWYAPRPGGGAEFGFALPACRK